MYTLYIYIHILLYAISFCSFNMLYSFVTLFCWNQRMPHLYILQWPWCRAWRAWDHIHSAAFLRVHGPQYSGRVLRSSRYSPAGLSNQTLQKKNPVVDHSHSESHEINHIGTSKCNLGHTSAVLDRLPSSDRHFPRSQFPTRVARCKRWRERGDGGIYDIATRSIRERAHVTLNRWNQFKSLVFLIYYFYF